MMLRCEACIRRGEVLRNVSLCREHFRITFRVPDFPEARPGQFVHLAPLSDEPGDYRVWELDPESPRRPEGSPAWRESLAEPMLRRAFSIAGLRREPVGDREPIANRQEASRPRLEGRNTGNTQQATGNSGRAHLETRDAEPGTRDPRPETRNPKPEPRHPTPDTRAPADVDVIYRVVGTATHWMAGLAPGDALSVLGPLGNAFPISSTKRHAWMVAGGVGLPPMLWLAEALCAAGRSAVAFCGARSADLMALTPAGPPPSRDARTATASSVEFAASGTPVVLATDDGTLGFAGHVGAALAAYHRAHPVPADDLVLYTCGPEVMMRFVAEFALARGIECQVCMERSMACGLGTCQSCVLPLRDPDDPAGWRYSLCCTEGPVYEAARLHW